MSGNFKRSEFLHSLVVDEFVQWDSVFNLRIKFNKLRKTSCAISLRYTYYRLIQYSPSFVTIGIPTAIIEQHC
jgi:hypothetical protein